MYHVIIISIAIIMNTNAAMNFTAHVGMRESQCCERLKYSCNITCSHNTHTH